MTCKSKLKEQLRQKIKKYNYNIQTEKIYCDWCKRYILFHNKRHPAGTGVEEVEKFLAYLAAKRNVAASTQNQALSAILFLYKEVLDIDLPWVTNVKREKNRKRCALFSPGTKLR